MKNKNKIFVYGTLRRNNKQCLSQYPGAEFVAEATTLPEYHVTTSYCGSYPAVRLNGNEYIQGEVWIVDEETFRLVDSYEEYPSIYNRTKIKTSHGLAWIYYIE